MNNSQRFSQSYSEDTYKNTFKSPKTPKTNISKELNQIERRIYEYPQSLNHKISEAASKSPHKSMPTESDSYELHKAILKRGEDYAKYILAQTRGSDPTNEVEKINQNIKKALNSLEDVRNDEQKFLMKKVTDLNSDFTRKIQDLERKLIKQVEKLKVDLMENIRLEEIESEKRVKSKADELVEDVAPINQREIIEKALRPTNYFTPTKSCYGNSPDKKKSQNYQQKLEESREKVREITQKSVMMTPTRTVRRDNEENPSQTRSSSSYTRSPNTPKPSGSLTEYKKSILCSISPSKEIIKDF